MISVSLKTIVAWASAAMLVVMAAAIGTPTAAAARERFGSLAGIVKDSSGAILPGVTVTVTNKVTQRVYSAVSGSDGSYRVLDLEPGRYTVRFELSGFATSDVADVKDSVENVNTMGLFNGQPAVIVLITRQPDANVIETVDSVRALVPELQAQLPRDVKVQVASESTNSIRASLHEIEATLLISIGLVIAVVSVFLRSLRATIIPAVATIVSLLGTFGAMYLMGF